MKRVSCCIVTMLVLLAGVLKASAQESKPPVYIYLHARITDHANVYVSEDRLHRIVAMVEQYRKSHPQASVSATVLLSGAMSQAFAQRKFTKDFILDAVHRGIIELGYDGTDEPTYQRRPRAILTDAMKPNERWLVRGE